jgi:rhodanese-related sulfurtransferase
MLAVAVPANLRCGQPEIAEGESFPLNADPGWAPLRYSFAGVWEIDPHGLEESQAPLQIVDVREAEEFTGPLGHIEGAVLIPLGQLAARLGELRRDQPIVAVCRAGSRSVQATVILQQAGFGKVANLNGGMLRWRAEGYPVEGGSA